MNQLFIAIGSLIVALLVAVLVAPFYINWSDYRTTIEREASVLFGHAVSIKGDIDVEILPTPKITATNIELGNTSAGPLMSAAQLRLSVELLALLNRDLKVSALALDKPQISLRLHGDGTTNWDLQDKTATLEQRFNTLLRQATIEDGSIYVVDEETGSNLRVEEIDAELSAQSLQGPWKIEGQGKRQGEGFGFKIATGAILDNKLRLKTTLSPQATRVDGIFDGELVFPARDALADGPVYKGELAIRKRRPSSDDDNQEQPAQLPFSLSGKFELDRSRFLLTEANLDDDINASPFDFNGTLEIGLKDPIQFEAKILSRQINLDNLYARHPGEVLSLQAAVTRVSKALKTLPKLPIPGAISVDVPGIVVAGDVIRGLHFDATPARKGWEIENLAAILPGTSRVEFDGAVQTDQALLVDGDLSLSSDRPIALARWWRPPPNEEDAPRINVRDLRFDGKISAEKNAIRLSDIEATLGESDFAGRLAYRRISERESQFDVSLEAKRLDLDAIQTLAAVVTGEENNSGFGAEDMISLNLKAENLVTSAVEGRDAVADLTIAAGEIEINSLKIADFAGAALDVAGEMRDLATHPAGRLSGTLKAEETVGLIKLGETLFSSDNAFLKHLKRNGEAFVPLDVEINFSGDQNTDQRESDFAASIIGRVGSGEIRTGMRFIGDWQNAESGDVQLSLASTYEDGSELLKQLGLPLLVDVGQGSEASINVRAEGQGDNGINLTSSFLLEDVRAKADGLLFLEKNRPPRYDTEFSLESDDIEPFLQLLGFSLPATGVGTALRVNGEWSGEGDQGRFENIKGEMNETELTGNLSYEAQPIASDKPWRWLGDLSVEAISFDWLAALGTGEVMTRLDFDISPESVGEAHRASDDPNEEKSVDQKINWSKAPFNSPYLSKMHLDLGIDARALSLTDTRDLQTSSFTLRLREDSLAINDLEADFEGGAVSGSLLFENTEGLVTLSSLLNFENVDAREIFWTDGQRPLVEGRLTGSLQLDGSGRSVDAMVGTLGGGGSVTLTEGKIRRINPSAFGLVLEAADKDGLVLDDETLRPLVESHLDAGVLDVKAAEASFTLSSGVARVSNMTFNHEALTSSASANLDFSDLKMNGTMTLSVDSNQIDAAAVSGSTPEIGILFEGDLTQPARRLDLQPFLSYLTVRRFEQEVRRIEILQADILEKQRLSRYARWLSAEEEREKRVLEEERLLREKQEEERRLRLIEERETREQEAREKAREEARLAAERQRELDLRRALEAERERLEQRDTPIPPTDFVPLELRPDVGDQTQF